MRRISPAESTELLTPAMEDAGRDYLKALELWDDLEGIDLPARGSRELRGRVAHLSIEAYRRGEISRGRLLDLSQMLGIDGRQLFELARVTRSTFRTVDLMVQMIREGFVSVGEADGLKDDWAENHRFRIPVASFVDLP